MGDGFLEAADVRGGADTAQELAWTAPQLRHPTSMEDTMPQSPPEGFPPIAPYLLYEDVDAMVDWLTDAFGFTERVRMKGPDGRAVHAEVELGGGVVMMGCPGSDYQNPKHLGGATQLVYVYVDDVDRHYESSTAHGALILRELADQFYGDRTLRRRGSRRTPVVIRPTRSRRRPARHAPVRLA